MSQIYIQEPLTSGRVILHTTVGDIDIELWCKETPKACRNFVQLCLEGYYEGVIFHRVVPGFIVQGGDPTGTGEGGESIYGEPFADEFHSRLRFTRRGLVGMASSGKDDNTSQFFITLGPTPELQNKHTLFGRVVGDTIFNVLRMEEFELKGERPVRPARITGTRVIEHPFDDIIPRTTSAERRAQREAAEKQRLEQEAAKKRPIKAVRNKQLLSFADDSEELTSETVKVGKIRSSHDVLSNDKRLSRKVAVDVAELAATPTETSLTKSKAKKENDQSDTMSDRTGHSSEAEKSADITQRSNVSPDQKTRERASAEKEAAAKRASSSNTETNVHDEIERIKAELRAMDAKRKGRDEETESKSKKKKTWLEETLEQYRASGKSIIGGRKKRGDTGEEKTLAMLQAFQNKLMATPVSHQTADKKKQDQPDGEPCKLHQVINCESCARDEVQEVREKEFEGDTWDESGWLSHELVFAKDTKGKDLMKRRDDIDDYVVIDPRVRQLAEKRRK